MKYSMKLSLKQMYACKHALEKTLKTKKSLLILLAPGKESKIYNDEQLKEIDRIERDIQSEEHLLKRFIEEIDYFKKINNIP